MPSYARQNTRSLVLLAILFPGYVFRLKNYTLRNFSFIYVMESASLHLSQLKVPAKVPLNKRLTNSSKVALAHPNSGSKDVKVPDQPESTRTIQREALKLAVHKQTLIRQVDLAESIIQSVDILRIKLEGLRTHVFHEDELSLNSETLKYEANIQKESASIEEQVLNVLERRVSEYEALVMKLGDRSNRLVSLYYETKDLAAQLNDSNANLIKRHVAESTQGLESEMEHRKSGDKQPRHDGKRSVKKSIKQ
ncbi:Hypothetical protein GLP15_2773 [Giardia lamblia P15]|uniref:Uncharacterized protein n=1 Tax=Giardia intestinalis (strain P15) TaxID=658858 RepID=E1EVK4_GIAIA|nr:Hypothetical protein GLP15_2773 [Giardia lamblia P15]